MKSNEEAIAELERSLQVGTSDFEIGHPEPPAPHPSNSNASPLQGPYSPPQQGPNAPLPQGPYAPPLPEPYAPHPQGPYAPPSQGSYETHSQEPHAPRKQGPYAPQAPGPYASPASGTYLPFVPVPDVPPPSYSSLQIEGEETNKVDEGMPSTDKRKEDESLGCCRLCSASSYIISCICAVILIITVPVFYSHLEREIHSLLTIILVATAILIIGAMFCYGESLCSREYRYLMNLDNAMAIEQRLTTLRNTAPNISIHAVAYHYETRTRTVFYTDSRGNRRTRTETYRQRVVTGTFNEVFAYSNWKDESESTIMDNISPNQVTRIKMDLVVKFGDAETQAAFNQQYERFKETYKVRDRFVDFSESRTVYGFESRLAACMDPSQRPWWIRERYYCIASLFGFTWPYRIMFNRATALTNYTLVKSVQCQRVPDAYPFVAPGFINLPYEQLAVSC